MALTPKETLQLYDVMTQQWPDKESLQKISPEQYFLENKFIPKSQARQYENELKKEFKSWADGKQLKKVQSVIQSLNSVYLERQTSIEKEWNTQGKPSSGKFFILRNFPKLVDQLRAQDQLPALVFSFDRMMCQTLSRVLTLEFEKRERVLRAQGGPRSLKLADKRRVKAEKRLKRSRDETEKEKGKLSQLVERCQDEEDFSALNEPLPECTLAFTHGIGKEGFNKIMGRIWSVKSSDIFKRSLKRGISYHHAGLNSKKRCCVEMLFREKCLQVIAATSTLALGIHMPCKTVVFAGDSPFLNSLQYRQMSGRAGRRGFDPVGNVVFFGVPYRKVQRLITANIPKLVGNFPINVSLVLRLLLMTSKGDDKDDALTKALALLSHPFICRKHPEMESQIKKHFLFSVELLARLSLINKENGAPQEMAGLATHLHYHEPSNFVLVSFVQRGLFHELCQPGTNGKFPEDVTRKMVLVLSHLFGRRFLHASFKRRIHSCPTSKVILEDLPDEFAEALQDYNRQVTDVFSQYLTTVAAELEKDRGEENKLPLSGIEFPDQASIAGDLAEHDIIKSLARSSILYSACSSFTALSGNSDLQLHSSSQSAAVTQEFEESSVGDEDKNSTEAGSSESDEKREDGETVNDESKDQLESDEEDDVEGHREQIDHLLKIVRQDVYTDMNVVPILPLKKYDSVGRVQHLNAFALDFFKHGSYKAIEHENRIKAGEVFFVLKDFYLAIKSISCSLEELGPESDNVVLAFKQLAQDRITMKEGWYMVIVGLPAFMTAYGPFMILLMIGYQVKHLRRWIATYAFYRIIQTKPDDLGEKRWLFKDMDLTNEKKILSKVLSSLFYLFLVMFGGVVLMFYTLLLLDVTFKCDPNDKSLDCFKFMIHDLETVKNFSRVRIDCNSAAAKNGTVDVVCYKIVLNFGLAAGASYGSFQITMVFLHLATAAFLMIKQAATICMIRALLAMLSLVIIAGVAVVQLTPALHRHLISDKLGSCPSNDGICDHWISVRVWNPLEEAHRIKGGG
ncbi:putative ATP-dependent RNA helicase ddx60 [Desmophyllum pertusum]|uniref:ATP-dependent RNA helicase ddx60 n=1 Tax=Desmophyllum pertusum TaxID=174260 RepID=A0A9X0D4U8_9CNID|nr:putative ATP-dependent RNA helicase ddx60 [Desmophyllum pertusum]